MKFISVVLAVVFLSVGNAFSIGGVDLGFKFGLSTPNDEVNKVFNSDNLGGEDVLGELYGDGAALGYHIGVNARIGLSDDFVFNGGIAWHRFPETELKFDIPQNNATQTIVLKTVQNIIPINAGLSYYFINKTFGFYGIGELTYNYISSTVDYQTEQGSIPLNLDTSPTDSRVGFGIGVGADLDAKILTANLEIKYNIANLIGQEDNEDTKSYVSVSLGVYL